MCDEIFVDIENTTIHDLTKQLMEKKPPNTLALDVENMLIAVNGIDSSALSGRDTILSSDDTVSIIPVIHGGARVRFDILGRNAEMFVIRGRRRFGSKYVDELRASHKKLAIQAVSSKLVLGASHTKKIIYLSLHAKRRGLLLTKKLETGILLRFACTTQISSAIELAGAAPGRDFVLLAIGPQPDLDALYHKVKEHLARKSMSDHSAYLKREFRINKKHMDSVSSTSPLEDILVEKASILL